MTDFNLFAFQSLRVLQNWKILSDFTPHTIANANHYQITTIIIQRNTAPLPSPNFKLFHKTFRGCSNNPLRRFNTKHFFHPS